MPTVQDLLASVDAARDEIVRLHQDLVRIPTVNYGSRPDTGNETPACELLRDKLNEAGIGSDIYESAPTRGNLIARIPGPADGKRLLLMSHSDVVPVEDETLWEHGPFSGTIECNRGDDACAISDPTKPSRVPSWAPQVAARATDVVTYTRAASKDFTSL